MVATFWFDNIKWFKNVDGLGGFSAELAVDVDEVNAPLGVAVADLDGDGDMDVVSTSMADGVYARMTRRCPVSAMKLVLPTLQVARDSSRCFSWVKRWGEDGVVLRGKNAGRGGSVHPDKLMLCSRRRHQRFGVETFSAKFPPPVPRSTKPLLWHLPRLTGGALVGRLDV